MNIHPDLDINQLDNQERTALLISVQLADYEVRNRLVKLLCEYWKVAKIGCLPTLLVSDLILIVTVVLLAVR